MGELDVLSREIVRPELRRCLGAERAAALQVRVRLSGPEVGLALYNPDAPTAHAAEASTTLLLDGPSRAVAEHAPAIRRALRGLLVSLGLLMAAGAAALDDPTGSA